VIGLSLVAGRNAQDAKPSLSWGRLVPWFIVGFLSLAVLRSLGVVPDVILQVIVPTATLLTIVSMAALGLGVDLRVLKSVGARVTLAVTLSLLVLIAISLSLIRLLGIA